MSTVLATQVRRHTAKPARAAGRYWKGKAPKGAAQFSLDSDEEEEQPEVQEEGDVLIAGEQDIVEDDDEETLPVTAIQARVAKTINLSLKDVNISKEGKVIVAGREESGRTKLEEEDILSEEESAEALDEEEESESSESEEELSKPSFRPVFVPKRGRVTIADRDALVQEAEEMEKRKQEIVEERKKQSHDLVAESIRRELLEKEKEEQIPDVDDTDGLDPAGEFEAWRLRELGRIKKEKEEELRREEEREEVERRRALPEEQRLKEDLARVNKLREEKPKGQQKFLQKYWHKGAFHQDDEILKRHDYTEATESTVDVSLLPEVMRVKNFGKRSRTKYTHLLDQDTTQRTGGFGGVGSVKTGGRSTEGGVCFSCGGPHLKKDCPQNAQFPPGARSSFASGANAVLSASRAWGERSSWRDRTENINDRLRSKEGRPKREDYCDDRARDKDRDYHNPEIGLRRSRTRSPSRSRTTYDSRRRSSPERDNDSFREKKRPWHVFLGLQIHIDALIHGQYPLFQVLLFPTDTNRHSHKMEIFIQGIGFAVTQEDLTIEFAKVLHKPPFPSNPLLNFEIHIFRKQYPKGKQGILALPTEDAGDTLLRAYGDTGFPVKGRQIRFRKSTQAIHKARINRLNTSPWCDPIKLREEKEMLLKQSRPFELHGFSFGRFLRDRDKSFSSEVSFPCTTAHVSCDLERRQIRLTFKPQSEESDDALDLYNMVFESSGLGRSNDVATASYDPTKITKLVYNQDEDTTTQFIRAEAPPVFSVDSGTRGSHRVGWSLRGCHSLMLIFKSQSDADTFKYACCHRLHLHHSSASQVRIHRISSKQPVEELRGFLSQTLFELAFEVEKTVASYVFSPMEILSLREAITALQTDHGPDAPEIFRSFVSEYEGSTSRPTRRRHQPQFQSSQENLTSLLGQVIHEFIREHQKPRRLLVPPPESGVYLSYHLILTPTRYILEGPLPDQSNSVLRRYGHHECFLRVTFQDENRSKLRRDFDSSITELLRERYRPILLHGYNVAGRRFEFLGYSMSGLREHSVWFMTPFHDEDGQLLNADFIRRNLGDFSELEDKPARLAARWSQAFSGTDPSITLLETEVDFSCPDKRSPSGNNVMTDGCSSISVELAKDIWRSLQRGKKRPAKLRNVPSAFQFRLSGAKGMVVQDPTVHGKLVRLRPSQVKFSSPQNLTFDVQSTSAKPKAMFLNRPLIVLMEFLGVNPRRIIELQNDAIHKAQSVRSSSMDASKVIQQHGLGASYHLPSLLSNLSSILHLEVGNGDERLPSEWTSELIESSLHCIETHVLRELKYRAHIAVPDSHTLLGVSDEWGCLREGEVYATVFDERTGFEKQITGKVAITRSPQIHPGDLQVVTAVYRPELKHLRNVVVFSCEGQRALASCLGGGDLDGDDFNLILDPNLLPNTLHEPGEYKALPIKKTPDNRKCNISDVVDFVFDYIEADLVGLIAIHHLRFSDLNDPSCNECLDLAKFASHAVDFPKTGTPVNFSDLPKFSKNSPRPDFLAREGADPDNNQFYNSKKLLGELFRRVPVKKWMPQEWNEDYSPSDGITVQEAFSHVDLHNLGLSGLTIPSGELTEEMTYLLDAYCAQLLVIGQTHTILKSKNSYVSEAELVSGTIMANWSDHHRRRSAVSAMNLQTRGLVRAVRAELLAKNVEVSEMGTYDEEEDDYDDWTFHEEFDEAEQRGMAETFKRSWAAWCVAEDALEEDPRMFGAQSFSLIALGRMLEIVKASYIM